MLARYEPPGTSRLGENGVMLLAMLVAMQVVEHYSAYTLNAVQKAQISKRVGDKLLDGDSAKYRWPQHTAQYGTYCGWVNAKNRYGAYIGFQPFFVLGGKEKSGAFFVSDVYVASDDNNDGDTAIVQKMCTQAGYDVSGLLETP